MKREFQTYLITNDHDLLITPTVNRFDSDITAVEWSDNINLTSKYDALIIDGQIDSVNPAESLSEATSIVQSLNNLSERIKIYLKSGGVVIYLVSQKEVQQTSPDGEHATNHDWMNELNLPEPQEEITISIKPTTEQSPASEYLKYIDETSYRVFSGRDISGEVLATGRKENLPTAVVFDEYKDSTDHVREMEGTVVFLPRLETFGGATNRTLKSLINIGENFSPRGFDAYQKKLPEFRDNNTKESDTEEYIIDSQLSDRCLEKFHRGENTDAVSTAGRILEARVKELCPPSIEDETGRTLMTKAFNKSDGPLRLATRDDEQEAVMFLFSGAIGALRNVAVHRPDGGGDIHHNIDERRARAILFYIDYLLSLLEEYESVQSMENS